MGDLTSTSLTLPTAGVGGSYYDTPFQVPVYPNSASNYMTWRMLDTWNNFNINYEFTRGIAVGLTWATLTYLLALTPHRSRRTPFHAFMLLGLVFIVIHQVIDITSSLTPGLQRVSAYTYFTADFVDSVWPRKLVTTFAASQVSVWLSLAFLAACLWLQARGLMTGLRLYNRSLYRLVSGFLIVASISAVAATMAYSIHQIITSTSPQTNLLLSPRTVQTFRTAYLSTYAVCIGSYSLVSMVSVMVIICKRPSSIMAGKSPYSAALNLIGLLCAQSFVIPFILSILQLAPLQLGIRHPEVLLLPSVYMILPLGSLFMTVNLKLTPDRHAENGAGPVHRAAPSRQTDWRRDPRGNALGRGSDNRATPSHDTTFVFEQVSSRLVSQVPEDAHIERELNRINDMTWSNAEEVTKEGSAEPEARLRDKDCQEKEVVVVMKMSDSTATGRTARD